MTAAFGNGIVIKGEKIASAERVLTVEACAFLASLHRHFDKRRQTLLQERALRQKRLDRGELPTFLPETAYIRSDSNWSVAKTPPPLQKRWVEITGPTDRKMVINALNSTADIFMADFEDANSPTWANMVDGQANLMDAVRETIALHTPQGKSYHLNPSHAVLFVRPRGWHLLEKHFHVEGEAIAGSLFDFGLFFFHNAQELIARGKGPYFYLPKLESHLEARLWNDVFTFAQRELAIPYGTIRATVLIETILAAFEIEEILYELRDHSAGCNAGRWDYIFSIIKKFRQSKKAIFPNRDQVTMNAPFMRAYAQLLVKICHQRKAHAIGGMSAFIPNRHDPQATESALQKVQEDKLREVQDGFDGTWVAHPDLVPIAREIFAKQLGEKAHQKKQLPRDVGVEACDLLDFRIKGGTITECGLRHNINVALQYLASWLKGIGAAAIYNLMEDAATAEISRAQIWQWLKQAERLEEGEVIDQKLVQSFIAEELVKIRKLQGNSYSEDDLQVAKELFEELVFAEDFSDFLTSLAYSKLP